MMLTVVYAVLPGVKTYNSYGKLYATQPSQLYELYINWRRLQLRKSELPKLFLCNSMFYFLLCLYIQLWWLQYLMNE